MKQAILDKVEEAFKKAEAYYGRTFSRPKHIIFKRSGTTGGHCWYANSELMFQIALAEQEGDKFLNRTPAHEVAHWIDKEVNGYSYTPSGRRDIHGKKWQFIMTKVMGLDASRCHSYDTSTIVKKKQAKHEYTCGCKSHFITTTIHNKILRGSRRICLRCRQRIVIKQFNAIVPQKPIDNIQAKIAELKQQIKELSK
jgi:SprT protein